MISVTSFQWVPPFAQGLVKDLRVRWALEEAGVAYLNPQIDFPDQPTAVWRARQPFGQVPIIEDDGLTHFESGAILLHIGEQSEALLPSDRVGRARATAWVFAALNSVEFLVQQLADIDLFCAEEDWAKARRPAVEERVRIRLADLATWLGDRDYLEGRFTVGDLMMTTVLRILRHTELVAEQPRLAGYMERCTTRPAFQRAFRAHMDSFEVR